MNTSDSTIESIQHEPPWSLHGHAYILNYWLSASFIKKSANFRLAPSPLGRVIQIMLVRYHDSPVGPYDELLLLDHPFISKRVLSTIPKIYVSTQISVDHGQALWGIPKELATFEWQEHAQETSCIITVDQQSFALKIKRPKKTRSFYINSHHLPASFLTIRQAWQGNRYQFSPQFRGHLEKISEVTWQSHNSLFPDLSKNRLLQSFYVPEFNLIFPKAQIRPK